MERKNNASSRQKINQVYDSFPRLLGQSGDSLKLLSRGGELIVEKSSTDCRLEAQVRLHKKFENLYQSDQRFLKTPRVVSEFVNGRYEMEYIFGLPLGFALATLSEKQIALVQSQLLEHFRALLDNSKSRSFPNSKVLLKLSDIENQLEGYGFPVTIKEKYARFRNEFEHALIPVGYCHGDFSLENLIFIKSSNSLAMLDFLDSPMSTPMFDLGRFWLDIKYGWWLNSHPETTSSWLNRQKMSKVILRIVAEYDLSLYQVDQFAFFSALRIIPYTNSILRMARLKYVILNSSLGRLA